MEIRKTASRIVYENPWMRVREDDVERGDGSMGIYGVVEKPDFALIVPLERDGGVHLVEQYRYPVEGRYWEFPQGSWEESSDVDPNELAFAELQEETGLRAGELTHVGHLFEAYGFSTQGFDIWIATDLEPGEQELDASEFGLRTEQFSRQEFLELLASGAIKDAPTVAAFGLVEALGLGRS